MTSRAIVPVSFCAIVSGAVCGTSTLPSVFNLLKATSDVLVKTPAVFEKEGLFGKQNSKSKYSSKKPFPEATFLRDVGLN